MPASTATVSHRPAPSTVNARPTFLMRSPLETVEASGIGRTYRTSVADLDATAWRAVQASGARAIVGALPFDRHAPAALYVPQRFARRAATTDVPRAAETTSPTSHRWTMRALPARDAFETAVTRALAALQSAPADGTERLTKVVLSRALDLTAAERIDPLQVIDHLAADLHAHVFYVPLGGEDDAPALVGASPELLVDKRGPRVSSRPMAGSAARRPSEADDREAARALAASRKAQHEHRLVVEFVLDTLAPYCGELTATPAPVLASTPTVWHLETPIDGILKRDVSVLELAAALHPTPAVCGTPRDRARALIADLEPFDREFFTGAVGWGDDEGDGRWVVAIRCARIQGQTARLYAGAGIVDGSIPAAEAEETAVKLGTMLVALGVDEPRRRLA